jgi:cellulose biosynthesis protein BcsQ
MKTIGFVNQKGGVGKSFASKVVANTLAGSSYKKRVLLVDCDDQETSVDLRRRDFSERDEFPYPVATCLPADLPAMMSGKKPLQVVTEQGFAAQKFDENDYDFLIVDMPGRGQSNDISGLLACLDYAIIVVNGDDSDSLSTIKFLKNITKTQQLRVNHNLPPLKVALMYNKFELTEIYKETVMFWEKQKAKHGIYKEVMFISLKETYRKYNDTYTNMLSSLKSNKILAGLYKEFAAFMGKLVVFLNQ